MKHYIWAFHFILFTNEINLEVGCASVYFIDSGT